MRKHLALALAALAATGASTMSTSAFATDHAAEETPVQIHQAATRTAGACTYTTALRGAYTAAPSTREATVDVRNAIIEVETRLECRGEAPQASIRQLYFAATTERELFARLADAARVQQNIRIGAHHQQCTFTPSVRREGSTVSVPEVASNCPVATARTARGGGPARGGQTRHSRTRAH